MRILAFLITVACILALLIKLIENKYLQPFWDHLWFHGPSTVTEKAVLIQKITQAAVGSDGVAYTNRLLKFDTDGVVIDCPVTGRIYRQVYEGMEGLLTHQETLFKCFEVGGVRIEK